MCTVFGKEHYVFVKDKSRSIFNLRRPSRLGNRLFRSDFHVILEFGSFRFFPYVGGEIEKETEEDLTNLDLFWELSQARSDSLAEVVRVVHGYSLQ